MRTLKKIFRAAAAPAGLLGLALILAAAPVAADQVILDDLIVDGSICAGFDCVNGESFGFDTIRMKENNLRLKCDDTSSTASFPDNDWQITCNETSNGGQEKFSIDDISNGKTPFTVEANAPSHSLYVDDGGRIGFGTSTPVVELHVKDGDSPTLRLEQDGSSGFTPQTWDVAGNETNFFVRDATNGSKLPLRIRPNSPSNSLFVDVGPKVGIGTSSPSVPLHVLLSGSAFSFNAATAMGVQNTSAAGNGTVFSIIGGETGNSQVAFGDTANEFAGRISYDHANDRMRFFTDNAERMILDATGNLVINGTCTSEAADCALDYVFNPEYQLESIEEHAASMWQNSYLPAVGPTPDNNGKGGQISINVFRKTVGMLEELEKAHIYIEQLHQRLAALEAAQAAE